MQNYTVPFGNGVKIINYCCSKHIKEELHLKIEMQKIDKMVKQEVNKKERNSEEKIAASATLF